MKATLSAIQASLKATDKSLTDLVANEFYNALREKRKRRNGDHASSPPKRLRTNTPPLDVDALEYIGSDDDEETPTSDPNADAEVATAGEEEEESDSWIYRLTGCPLVPEAWLLKRLTLGGIELRYLMAQLAAWKLDGSLIEFIIDDAEKAKFITLCSFLEESWKQNVRRVLKTRTPPPGLNRMTTSEDVAIHAVELLADRLKKGDGCLLPKNRTLKDVLISLHKDYNDDLEAVLFASGVVKANRMNRLELTVPSLGRLAAGLRACLSVTKRALKLARQRETQTAKILERLRHEPKIPQAAQDIPFSWVASICEAAGLVRISRFGEVAETLTLLK